MELSRIAVPIIVLPKDDRTGFAQEEQPGSSILDHEFGHLCFGRRIQISGHSDFGIFNKDGASSILTWVQRILRLLLVLRILVEFLR